MSVIQTHVGSNMSDQLCFPVKKPDSPDDAIQYLESTFHLHRVSCMSWKEKTSNFSFFQGYRGTDKLFIKWGGKSGSSINDYTYTSRLYDTCPDFFLRPSFCVSENGINCMALEYVEGRTLEDAILGGSLTMQERASLVIKLPLVAQALIDANCVHRDIKPSNIMILPDRSIRLFDFEFATDAQGYREREEIRRVPHLVSNIGTDMECGMDLGIGRYQWDDMVIFRRILKLIGSSPQYAAAYEKADHFFRSHEGLRRIRFPGRRRLLVKRKLINLLAVILPVRAWRNKVRQLNKTPQF
ncbi:MAG: protein kinase [Oxalobacter sp.]|nr:protein kinase [Oxalobacter sp.]